MALKITITDAGRAELINADNTGTGPVEITHIAFTETAFTPSKTQTALPDEIKRFSSIAGEVVADDTISVTAKDEGTEAYTVHGFGLISEYGTLFAVYSQEAPIIEKSGPTTLLLTVDIILADLPAASLTFGDISFSNPPASTTTPGVVRLSNATDSTAQNLAATPQAVKLANDNANSRLGKSANLADLTNPATARVNLGLGASATLGNTALRTSSSTTLLLQAAAMNDHRTSGDHDHRYPQRSNNLSDLTSPSQARSNLGLGASATMGTTASRSSSSTSIVLQAKAMNDHRTSGDHDHRYPQRSNNLSDLTSPSQARSNLGLGASATMGTTASRSSSSTSIVLQAKAMNDHRTSGDHDGRYYQKGEFTDADTPNAPMRRNSAGDVWARLFRSSYSSTNSNIAAIYTTQTIGGDFMRPSTPAQVKAALSLHKNDVGLSNLPNSTTSSRTSSSTASLLQAKAMNDHRLSGDHDGRYVRPSDFTRTGTLNGVQRLPNGFLFQYGYVDYGDFADERTVPVTFNTTFPNQAFFAAPVINSGQASVSVTQRNFTNAGFTAVVKEFDTVIAGGRLYWFAIGY